VQLRARSLAVLALLCAWCAPARAAVLPAGTTAILSGDASLLAPLPEPVAGTLGFDPFAERASVSADGRYAVFLTNVPALGAAAGVQAEFVRRDTVTGAIVPVSVDGAGAPMPLGLGPFLDAFNGSALSADGNRFAFEAPGRGGFQEIWVRDVAAGTTTLASSERIGGVESAGAAFSPSISADGNRVAFGSNAADLVAGFGGGTDFNVFVRDLAAQATFVASVADQGGGHGGNGGVISRDGDHVAFSSNLNGLVPGDGNDVADVFVRDFTPGQAPRTRLASIASTGAAGDGRSDDPAISADGSRVAFVSTSHTFGTTLPQPGSPEVWVHDFADGSTRLVSVTSAGVASGDLVEEPPAISADGRFVAFLDDGPDLVANGPDRVELYRRDVDARTTLLVSRGQGAAGNPSKDDHLNVDSPSLTADGGCVTFDAEADLLGPGAVNGSVYMRVLAPDCGRPGPPPPPGPSGPVGVPAPPPRDRTAPVLSAVSLSHARFAAGARTGASALRFTTSEAGRLTVVVERALPGRKVHRACRAVPRPVRRGACTLLRRAATLTAAVKAGRGSLALGGRAGRRALAPGSYRLTLTVRDAAGNVSKPARRAFTLTVAARTKR
jgi:Tol biopolymer transport system component